MIDISAAGASIECEMSDNLPRAKAMISLHVTLLGCHESFSALAKVVWVRRLTEESAAERCRIGVKFVNLDEKEGAGIWDFISENSLEWPSFLAC